MLKRSACTCLAQNQYHFPRRVAVPQRDRVARFHTLLHLFLYFGKTGKKKKCQTALPIQRLCAMLSESADSANTGLCVVFLDEPFDGRPLMPEKGGYSPACTHWKSKIVIVFTCAGEHRL
jgi:hypothetical protein